MRRPGHAGRTVPPSNGIATLDLIAFMTQRTVIVGLAIAGAMMVMASSLLGGRDPANPDRRAMLLSKAGYAVTFVSIILFIAAGFLSGR